MVKLTKAQRVALKRIFDRDPTIYPLPGDLFLTTHHANDQQPLTYRQFRSRVQGTFFMNGCVMVHWCGMWLGIEPDGYTHS